MDTTCRFRSAYSPRKRVLAPLGGPSMADQSAKDECDINVIMARYLKTGILPEQINENAQRYLDCTENDFQAAMQVVAGAASLFEQLPAKVRDRFGNDPSELLSFVADDSNRPEAEKLGLVPPAPSTHPQIPQTNQTTSAGKQTAPAPADNPPSGGPPSGGV